MDVDAELELARLRVHREIERRTQLALGVDPRTVNRSVGQTYTRRIVQLEVVNAVREAERRELRDAMERNTNDTAISRRWPA